MANPSTKAAKTDFNETFIFWVMDNKIYKGRSVGAHLPFIKQVSGFEGSIFDIIEILFKKKINLIMQKTPVTALYTFKNSHLQKM